MSTWNMPPGVSTNDIPGNEPEPMSLLDAALKLSDELHRWEAKGVNFPLGLDLAWGDLTAAIETLRATQSDKLQPEEK